MLLMQIHILFEQFYTKPQRVGISRASCVAVAWRGC
jgi:hypothetical protein